MKVLFIGGTGVISSACSKLAVERGVDLILLNRGRSIRPAPAGAKVLHADFRDPGSIRRAEEIAAWYDADVSRRKVDKGFDRLCDRILNAYATAWPGHPPYVKAAKR